MDSINGEDGLLGRWVDNPRNELKYFICQKKLPVIHEGKEILFRNLRKNFDNARKACESEKGGLLIVKDETTQKLVEKYLGLWVGEWTGVDWGSKFNHGYWIGASNVGEWRWLDGTAVPMAGSEGYSNWLMNEPNNGGNAALAMLPMDDMVDGVATVGMWADSLATQEKYYICQKSLCADSPCLHEGTCSTTNTGFVCDCTEDYYGERCEVEYDSCHPNPCYNFATCSPHGAAYTCICPGRFEGEDCAIDKCDEYPCLNGGSCDYVDELVCGCVEGYNGTHCEVDLCEKLDCLNNGVCDVTDGVHCVCSDGYNGTRCEHDLCEELDCLNNGDCYINNGGVECDCLPRYNGRRCQYDICNGYCSNGGTCVVGATSPPSCACPYPYSGEICEKEMLDIRGEYCMYEVDEVKVFDGARQHCSNMGGGLVIIDDDSTQGMLEQYLVGLYGGFDGKVWIGGVNYGKGWYWLDGSMVPTSNDGFTNWGDKYTLDEPNQCLSMQSNADQTKYVWVGTKCNETFKFICEKPVNGTDLCSTNECLNGGECKSSGAHAFCDCSPEYTGQHCETRVKQPGEGVIVLDMEITNILTDTNVVIIAVSSALGVVVFILLLLLLCWCLKQKKVVQPTNLEVFETPVSFEHFEDIDTSEPKPTRRTLTDKRILHAYQELRNNNDAKFQEEFNSLNAEEAKLKISTTVAQNIKNKQKNRNKLILPYNNNRVKLETRSDNRSDYINASYIESDTHKYIATQAPMKNTVVDFWAMVWEQRCPTIVMLTNLTENGKVKCEKYWPDKNSVYKCGDIHIVTMEETMHGCYVIRKLQVSMLDKNKRTIVQYQFLTWGEHDAPTTTSGFFKFFDQINEGNDGNEYTVVHCSDGVGRTGSFIAFNFILSTMEQNQQVDVYDVIMQLRKQRPYMVQTLEQYIFLHKLLLEDIVLDDCEVNVDDINMVISQLDKTNHIGKTILQTEYENLDLIEPIKTQQTMAMKMNSNRDEVLPYDHNLPVLDGGGYYNASVISEPQALGNNLIIAQSPTMQSLNQFWNMVWNNDVTMIIMLTLLHNNEREVCARYWPVTTRNAMRCGEVLVKLDQDGKIQHDVRIRKLTLYKGNNEREVTQLQFTGWPQVEHPPLYFTLLEWLDIIGGYRGDAEYGAVMVHCTDGAGRSGVVVSLVNIIQQIKNQNQIDVFRAVKDLRDYRPNMVNTEEQYRYIYETIKAYVNGS
nr:receptor-type tyrosine-protein phosphatase epsilon-like isoform X1 [Ciona intestinalis]|eukprot:XP_026695149.1 receptor-type tyrosine-protein phosphatase epsilon-like isoform X1 [Ciona intestinalis]